MILTKLTRSFRSKDIFSIPSGQRVYAVGDIHGRLDLLKIILERIAADHAARSPAAPTIIFLGDLVDRGSDSMGVIELLRTYRIGEFRLRFLLGNHDEVFLKALRGDEKALRLLTRIGGKETILSYGLSESEYESTDFPTLARVLGELVPEEHLRFLETFETSVEIGDYLFVHAGIRPGCPIADQKPSDLRWIREEFLSSRKMHPKMIVHGHSICGTPEIHPNRIGIDTGAFGSGKLTALGLEGEDRWFLDAIGEADLCWGILTD